MASGKSTLPFLLALGGVILIAKHTNFKAGDERNWTFNLPTGKTDDRCMVLTRHQYVPFWCVVGLITLVIYAFSAFLESSSKGHVFARVKAALSKLRSGRQNSESNTLTESLLESGKADFEADSEASTCSFSHGTIVDVVQMQSLCEQLGCTSGVQAAALAIFVAMQKRRTYGAISIATLKGDKVDGVNVELYLPSMPFIDLLRATDSYLQKPPAALADEKFDVTFAWGNDFHDETGCWRAELTETGQLLVKGDNSSEEEIYKTMFQSCSMTPDKNIWEVQTMSEITLKKLAAWGRAPKNMENYRGSAGEIRTFPEIFTQLDAPGDNLAVIGEGFQLTYSELRRRVAAVAQAICREANSTVELKEWSKAVIVFMGRGEAVAPAFFGVLHAGCMVVPIDVHWPAERVQTVAEDSSSILALTEPATQNTWVSIPELPKSIIVDQTLFQLYQGPLELSENINAQDAAIVLFTSGSTGKPKGIILSHSYVMTLAVGRAESLQMSSQTRTLLHQSPTWMPFIDYLFGPVLKGGCCVLVPEQSNNHAVTPASLRMLAQEHGATILGFVPPVLDIFLDEDSPPSLQCICVGGAAVPRELCKRTVADFEKRQNGTRLFLATGYHGTEQGDVTQIQIATDDDVDIYANAKGFMTSGNPHTTQNCAVLDQSMQLVAPGGIGEITVAGSGLASGYLNLPDKTAETFLKCKALGDRISMRTSDLGRWTSNGSLEVVGRRDSMVKVRGARVELGEVEASISAHSEVRACVVIVHEDRLVAYVSPAVPGDLKELCKTRLASYMVPHIFEGLESLPQLSNGKINKKALPAPSESAGGETIMELDSLGQMRKLTRTSITEDRILDNCRAMLMIIVIQSHATPLVDGDLNMYDMAHGPVHGAWSYMSYFLLQMSRKGGWSALAYMGGFDDTRGDSSYKLTYREALFLGLWGISGFKWNLWFLPAFVYMRVLFVAAHKYGVMRLHMLILSQLWLTVPAFIDWYVGWRPAPQGEPTTCPSKCICPFQGPLWHESIAYYTFGMWTVGPAMISHSFVGRALFFIPCYWLGFYTGRPVFKWLSKITDEFTWKFRLLIAIIASAMYLAFFTVGTWIEGEFDDRCGSFWDGEEFKWMQIVKNVGFYTENIVTSVLYVVIVVAALPIHLKKLAKTCFAAYVLTAFQPFFCLVDLPVMALEIRKVANPTLSPLLETFFIFAQPTLFVLVSGSLVMLCIQLAVKIVQSLS